MKTRRVALGWSQGELAKRAQVAQASVWKLEAGRPLLPRTAAKIVAALDPERTNP